MSWFGLGPALRDLVELRDYISHDKPSAAHKLAQTIRKNVLRLQEHPNSGRIVPELPHQQYREVIVTPYRIIYEVKNRRIIILRVWHSRRAFG